MYHHRTFGRISGSVGHEGLSLGHKVGKEEQLHAAEHSSVRLRLARKVIQHKYGNRLRFSLW